MANKLRDFIQAPPDPEEGTQEQQLFEAVVHNTAKKASDEVFVTIPEFDEGQHKFGPVIWRPVELGGKEIFPTEGDLCLVAKPTLTGQVWLIDWS